MAIKGQTAVLSVATAVSGGALAITAATSANPVVLTVTNTFVAGDLGVVQAVVGETQLNNRAFIITAPSGSVATLKGEDGSSYGTYVSGGTIQKYTMTALAQVTDVKGFDGQASEIDTTHLLSTAKEFVEGLQDFGNVNVGVFLANADAGQTFLRKIKSSAALTAFSLSLSDGTVAAFMAFVKQFAFDGVKPDGAVSGTIVLRVSGQPAWFA